MLTRRLEEPSWSRRWKRESLKTDGIKKRLSFMILTYNRCRLVVFYTNTYNRCRLVVFYTSIYVLIGCENIPRVGCCDPQGPQLLYFIY